MSSRLTVDGSPVPGSIISPVVATDKFATTVIVDLTQGAAVRLQLFGLVAVATLSTQEPIFLTIVKLQ